MATASVFDKTTLRFRRQRALFLFALRPAASGILLAAIYALIRALFIWNNPSALGLLAEGQAGMTPLGSATAQGFGAFVMLQEHGKLLRLFAEGLRFDLSAIVLANVLFLAFYFLVFPFVSSPLRSSPIALQDQKSTEVLSFKYAYLVVNCVFFAANLLDVYYFPFSGRRSTFEVFALKQDMGNQFLQLAANYWFVPLQAAVLSALFVCGERKFDIFFERLRIAARDQPMSTYGRRSHQVKTKLAVSLLWIAALVLAARGGLGRKPISVASAYEHVDSQLAPAALNSTFTSLKSFAAEPLPFYKYSSDAESQTWIKNWVAQKKRSQGRAAQLGHLNVVVLILESFGLEYFGDCLDIRPGRPNYVPFLCELASKSVFFTHAFANGRTSIDSFLSIQAGIPAVHSEPIVSSPFGANEFPGLAARLAAQGYDTAFYHGGKNGTMFFDLMAKAVGFKHYFGLTEYPKEKQLQDTDGTWGIFDEPFLQFTAQSLAQKKEPFFASAFTLSSHNPYRIPVQYQGHFPKGTLPIHESIGYTDHALREFFKTVQAMPWYQNTLFVVTADHTSTSDDPEFGNPLGRHRVPILFFSENADLHLQPGKSAKLVQHTDIAPSIAHLLGLPPGPESFFGQNVFAAQGESIIFNRNGAEFWFAQGNDVLQLTDSVSKHSKLNEYLFDSPSTLQAQKNEQFESNAKNLIQAFFTMLQQNSFLKAFDGHDAQDPH